MPHQIDYRAVETGGAVVGRPTYFVRRFQQFFPDHSVLLVDTYDTLAAIEKIIHAGLRPKSVRLDSGDLVDLSRQVRRRP